MSEVGELDDICIDIETAIDELPTENDEAISDRLIVLSAKDTSRVRSCDYGSISQTARSKATHQRSCELDFIVAISRKRAFTRPVA